MKAEKKEQEDEKGSKITSIARWTFLGICVLWLLNLIVPYLSGTSPENAPGFGDMFGAVNSLFSGFALAGIIITILMQREELQLQRKELALTRKEFAQQNETMRLQRFENTFFNLLQLHHQIVQGIDYRYEKVPRKKAMSSVLIPKEPKEVLILTGRDVFQFLYRNLAARLSKSPASSWEELYFKEYLLAQTDFGHYFRNLYRIVKLVDEATFSDVEREDYLIKYRYTSILRAQLSDFETLWLFYNGVSRNGAHKFKGLIEKYSLLKTIPINLLAHSEHFHLYESSAMKPKN